MARTKGSLLGLLIGGAILIIVGGAFFFFVGKPAVEQGSASVEWPTAQATVVRSKVTTSSSDGDTMYSADVAYKYTVDGREYESNVVRFGGDFSSSESSGAHRIVNEYPEGMTIAVHYSPEEPAVATIETGTHWFGHLAWWIGIGAMLLGACLLAGFVVKLFLGVGILAGAAVGAIGKSPSPRGNTASSRDPGQWPGPQERRHEDELARDIDAIDDDDDGISLH